MPAAARSDEPRSRPPPFPSARPPPRDRWAAGGDPPPACVPDVVEVAHERMRGSQSSSCKISLMFCRDLRADGVPLTPFSGNYMNRLSEMPAFRPCAKFRMADNSVEAVTWCVKCECATTVVSKMNANVPLYSARRDLPEENDRTDHCKADSAGQKYG